MRGYIRVHIHAENGLISFTGSRLCTTITVPKGSSQENNPSFNPNDTCGDGTKATVVDLTSIARNSRLLYALPEENDNSCSADDLSPISQMEDDVFVLLDQHVQRPFQSQNLSDTSNDYSNTDQLDLSKQQTTDSKTEHHHPPWQRYTPYPPQQIGNTFNVFPANTSSGNTRGNTNACCIHTNGVQSNNRPASLDWKFVKQQSSQSTKNWSSASDTLGLLSTEQTEKPKLPMRICLAEVGIARLFPFCDSDKAKMVVIAKQAIVSKHEECGTISHFINQ